MSKQCKWTRRWYILKSFNKVPRQRKLTSEIYLYITAFPSNPVDAWPSKLDLINLNPFFLRGKKSKATQWLFFLHFRHKDSEFLPVWLAEILDAFYTSSPRTRRPLMVFFPYLSMLTAVFSHRIFLLSKRGVNQIEFTFITHFFPMGFCAYFLWSILQSSDRFLVHFGMMRELTVYWGFQNLKPDPKPTEFCRNLSSAFCGVQICSLKQFPEETWDLHTPCLWIYLVPFPFISLLLPPLPITFSTTSEML